MSSTNPVVTTLEDNAIPVSQQAAAYAIRQETQFVGLFDWNSTAGCDRGTVLPLIAKAEAFYILVACVICTSL